MASEKKITVAKYDVDIKEITSKINAMKNLLNDSNFGAGFTTKFQKEITALQAKLAKLENVMPGSGASIKEIEKFGQKMEDLRIDLHKTVEDMRGFNITDDYLRKNIKSVQKLEEALRNLQEETKKIRGASVKGEDFVAQSSQKKAGNDLKKNMKKAAAEGSREQVKTLYGNYSKIINKAMRDEFKTSGDSDEYKKLLEDREALHALEQAYLKKAENVKKSLKEEEAAQLRVSVGISRAREKLVGSQDEVLKKQKETDVAFRNSEKQIQAWKEETSKADDKNKDIQDISNRIKDFFSITSILYTMRGLVREAINDFRELDQQFNEIAIVSQYSTKEMWQNFSEVNKMAQEYGVTTKNILEVQNLYYHQGKEMAEVDNLTAQTLTLAKITGMNYEDATNKMTAALNAYKIAAEDAVKVTDTLAALDSNAAISSEELMTALTKTASIAANAGMSLENTEVFLTKMIETTREAPENLGTALKTIIARFGEVKQEIDGQEVELADVNRVDTALKTIGITLLDTAGQIRDLDDVFMELSAQWDNLDRNTQRYIATQAAGSRQQSRFIAMMENYDRTLELVDIAQNAAGISARQLQKSQESIQSSMNRLKSSWQEFYSTLISAGAIKGVIELGNSLVTLLNRLNDLSPGLGLVAGAMVVWGAKILLVDKVMKALSRSLVEGGLSTLINLKGDKQLLSIKEKLLTKLGLETEAIREHTRALNEDSAAQLGNNKASMGRPMTIEEQKAKGFLDKNGAPTEKKRRYEDIFKNAPVNLDSDAKRQKYALEKIFYQDIFKGESDKWKKVWNIKEQTGKASSTIKDLPGLFKGKGSGLKTLLSGKLTTALAKAAPLIAKISTALTYLVNPLTITIGLLAGAYAAYRKFMGQTLDDTKNVKKLGEAQDKYNSSLKEYSDLKKDAEVYEKYRDKTGLSPEQLQEQKNATESLAKAYPNLIERIDEEGNYHLKNKEAIDAEIEAKKNLVRQNAESFTKLKFENAKKGIYADPNSQAGAAMKNFQSYAASLDEDSLKDIAKTVDKGVKAFDKSRFYDAMEAYASGKKSSFGAGEFTDWFAGDISSRNWNNIVLKTLSENSDIYFSEKGGMTDKFADLLDQAGYSRHNAEKVVESFNSLNQQTAGLLEQMLQGAANEYSEIEIQEASLRIDTANMPEEFSNEMKDAVAKAVSERVSSQKDYKDLSEEEKTKRINDETDKFTEAVKELDKNDLDKLGKIFSNQSIGGIAVSDAASSINPDNHRQTVLNFYNALDEEIQKLIDEDTIKNGTDEVIETLFQMITKALGDVNLTERIDGLVQRYRDSANMYLNPGKMGKLDLEARLNDLTVDQIKLLEKRTVKLSDEQIATYMNAVMPKLSGASRAEQNALLGADFSNEAGLIKAQEELKSFGYTAQQTGQMAVDAMGDIDNISLSDFATTAKQSAEEIEKLQKGLDGVGALLEGKANFAQMSEALTQMQGAYSQAVADGTMSIQDAEIAMQGFSNSIVATSEGFQIGGVEADKYSNHIVSSAKQMILLQIALRKTKLATEGLSEAERLEITATIGMLEQQYAYIDASEKAAKQKGLEKKLQKEKEKADKLKESLQALVDWLRDFDRYSNLDGVIKDLDEDLGHLEYEITFSTNTDVIAKDLNDKIYNINSQIAANQGGIRAAQSDQAMWKNVIQSRNSKYVSFDAAGNAVVKTQELQRLQEQIAKADEYRQPILKAEYDEIMKNVEAYNKSKDKVESYTKALEENFKQLEEVMKKTYESITTLENKLIEVRKAAEDKELEAVKKKYDAIKEEDQKYLDSVRKTVDKEREIRDRSRQKEAVKDKERRLAMMRMDTSGVYASEIANLEKELEQDYQDLEDNVIDEAIANLEEQKDAQAEALDKEIEYLENALEYKREKMIEYNEWANQMIMSGSDTVLAYLKANDAEYYTGTAAAQAQWTMEWQSNVSQGIAANQVMRDSLFADVFSSLDACKGMAGGFEQAVVKYSQTAQAQNKAVGGSVQNLTTYYEGLAGGVDGVTTSLGRLQTAYNNAANAAKRLADENDRVIRGKGPSAAEITNTVNELKKEEPVNPKRYHFEEIKEKDGRTQDRIDSPTWTVTGWHYPGTDGREYYHVKSLMGAEAYVTKEWINTEGIRKGFAQLNAPLYRAAFAKGGYVDFTGPAWVDGTKSHPEYMLNALQTEYFEKFINVLDTIFSHSAFPSFPSQDAQKIGDAIYNFHIQVEKMASDYDVDKMVERIQKKISSAGKYRNINILKNN